MVAGLSVIFGAIPLGGLKPPEYSARFYPEDTAVYLWATLAPANGQRGNMQEIWDIFQSFSAFEDLLDQLEDDADDEADIDLEDDLMPWIGPSISVALLDRDEDDSFAAVIGVRDEGAAEDFLDKWRDYMEDEERADFQKDSDDGFDIWADEDSEQFYALSGDWLVVAISEDAMEDVLDRINSGSDANTLAVNTDFVAARAAMPDVRFASLWIDIEGAVELLDANRSLGDAGANWMAYTAAWIDRGVRLEMVMPAPENFGLALSEAEEPTNILPEDTLAFLSVGFNPSLDRWREVLGRYDLDDLFPLEDEWEYENFVDDTNYNVEDLAYELDLRDPPQLDYGADLTDVLDMAVELLDKIAGIDSEDDFFGSLSGGITGSVSAFDFEEVEDDPEDNPIDAFVIFPYQENSEEDLAEVMEDVLDKISDAIDVDTDSVDVDADEDAEVIPIEDTDYSPGYVLYDGYLTLATTEDALETIVELQDGSEGNLSSNREYTRAESQLPSQRHILAWLDLQNVIDQWDPGLDRDYDSVYEVEGYELAKVSLGSAAASFNMSEDYWRAAFVLTLFPE